LVGERRWTVWFLLIRNLRFFQRKTTRLFVAHENGEMLWNANFVSLLATVVCCIRKGKV
jgi:hypothetical protein